MRDGKPTAEFDSSTPWNCDNLNFVRRKSGDESVLRPTEPATPGPQEFAEPPQPTARYGSYRVACDSLRRISGRALGAWADSARWTRSKEEFWYWDPRDPWGVGERTERGS